LNEQTTIEGRVAGISDKGELILLKANQQLQRFNAGEIERVLAW
jgi:biotin-(acetyl-CoA carboxylase) ligase